MSTHDRERERRAVLEQNRKDNIIKRSKLREMFKREPEAVNLLRELFHHPASELARVESNDRVRVMIGHNEVIETLTRIEAMEDETTSVKE